MSSVRTYQLNRTTSMLRVCVPCIILFQSAQFRNCATQSRITWNCTRLQAISKSRCAIYEYLNRVPVKLQTVQCFVIFYIGSFLVNTAHLSAPRTYTRPTGSPGTSSPARSRSHTSGHPISMMHSPLHRFNSHESRPHCFWQYASHYSSIAINKHNLYTTLILSAFADLAESANLEL